MTVATDKRRTLHRSLRLVTLGVCLCMVYIPATASPMFTEFMREMGATEFHFGLLTGIPMTLFILQFIAAFLNNRVRNRKIPFMILLIAARLVYLLVAFTPRVLPMLTPRQQVHLVILLVTCSAALMNLAVPLWFAWMADIVPRRILGRYWGNRQRWMFLTWTATYVAMALFTYLAPWPITVSFPLLAMVSVTAGVADILLFVGVPEPGNTLVRDAKPFEAFLEPFRHKEYRTFVRWSVIRSFAMLFAAPFMLLYALDVLQMPLWQATVAWCLLGLGTSISSRWWGRLADAHGQRPVLILTMAGKPVITLLFVFVTAQSAFPVLATWFLFDGILNGGLMVATDGFMLRMAPQRNRSMFVATITGLAGISAGLGAILGGRILQWLSDGHTVAMGREWNHYQIVFAVSFLMRVLCIPLTLRIREPKSSSPMQVLEEVAGMPQLQFLRYPVGLYRRIRGEP